MTDFIIAPPPHYAQLVYQDTYINHQVSPNNRLVKWVTKNSKSTTTIVMSAVFFLITNSNKKFDCPIRYRVAVQNVLKY